MGALQQGLLCALMGCTHLHFIGVLQKWIKEEKKVNERVLGAGFNESYFETINAMEKPKGLNYEELNQAAKSLDMEKDKARSNGEELDKVSGVWKEYEPKHQEISAVIDALKRVLGDNEKTVEEHQEAINKATSFLKEGAEFFRKENDLVYGEIKEMHHRYLE